MTKKEQAQAALKVLVRMEGHGIYRESILKDLPESLRNRVPVHTTQETQAAIDARGLGGFVEPSNGCVWGYTTAAVLAKAITGEQSAKMGRGSAFRDNVALISAVAKGK